MTTGGRLWPPGLTTAIAAMLAAVTLALPMSHSPLALRAALLAALLGVWAVADRAGTPPGLVVSSIVVALVAALVAGRDTFAAIFLVLLAAQVAMAASLRATLAVTLASVSAVAAPVLLLRSDGPLTPVFWAGGVGLVAVFGRLMHRQRRLTAQLQAAQAKLLEHAVQAEQRRIAREIHDLVAQLLSVTMLHVTAARLALTTEPDEAAASLADAERLGRHGMVELRRTIGLLRGAETSLAPLPSAAEIGELVERFRSAGMLVRLDVSGDPATLAPSTGLGLYRVVQESLSNVARHAPDATVSVAVNTGPGGASATVYSEPAGPAGAPAHGGLGVLGMRERASLLGGTLAAGPAGPGWLVECRIPAAGGGVEPGLT